MRRAILVLIFALLSLPALATTYYVANAGSDAANGTSTGTPWQTIAHVNSQSFAVGDSILFNCGDIWHETFTAPSSGSAGNVITFGQYGTCSGSNNPIIDGANVETGWAADGNTYVQKDSFASAPNSQYAPFWYYKYGAFQFTPTASYTLTQIAIQAYGTGTGVMNAPVTAYIYSDSTNQPGSLLATATATQQYTLNGTPTYYSWYFTGLALTSGTPYWVVYYRASTEGTTNSTLFETYVTGGHACQGDPGSWSCGTKAATIITYATQAGAANVYDVSLPTQSNQVFLAGVRTPAGTSKATLTQHQWVWSGGTLSFYESGGNPDSVGDVIWASQRNNCLDLNGKNYLTAFGIAFRNANVDNITSSTAASHPTFTNISSTYAFQNGIDAQYGVGISNGTVTDSTLSWNGASGLYLHSPASNWYVARNTINNNTQYIDATGDHQYSGGIRVFMFPSTAYDVLNNVFEKNLVCHNGVLPDGTRHYENGPYNGGDGIWLDTVRSLAGNYSDANIVRYNLACDNTFSNLHFEHTGWQEMLYNVTYGAYAGTGGTGTEINADDYTYVSPGIYNNEIVGNTSVLAVSGEKAGLLVVGSSTGDAGACVSNLLKNNIVWQLAGTTPVLQAYYGCANESAQGSGNVYSNNDLGPTGTGYIEWGLSSFYNSLAAWVAASSQTGNQSADPLFVNSGADNFSLGAGSPAIGAGLNLGSTYIVGLSPGTVWPSGVLASPQCTAWNEGAYVQANCSNALWMFQPF